MEGLATGITQSQALTIIAGIEGEIWSTGAVDTEPNALNVLRTRMEAGDITPDQAVNQARRLSDSRQNYH